MFILPLVTDGVRSRALAVALVVLVFVAVMMLVITDSDEVWPFLIIFVFVFIPTYMGNSIHHSPRWGLLAFPACVAALLLLVMVENGVVLSHPVSATFAITTLLVVIVLAVRLMHTYRGALGCSTSTAEVYRKDEARRRPLEEAYVRALLGGVTGARRRRVAAAAKERAWRTSKVGCWRRCRRAVVLKMVGTDEECVFYPTRFLLGQFGSLMVMIIFTIFVLLTRARIEESIFGFVDDFKILLRQYSAALALIQDQQDSLHTLNRDTAAWAGSGNAQQQQVAAGISALDSQIAQADVNKTLAFDYDAVANHADNLGRILPTCMTIAVVIACLSLTFSTVVAFPLFREHALSMRGGRFAAIVRDRLGAPLSAAGDYVGMQVSSAVISFIVVASGMTLALAAIAWSVTRNAMLKLAGVLIPLLLVSLLRMAWKRCVVDRILSDGETVRHRRCFTCNDFAMIFYVSVEGLLLSTGRMTYTLLFTFANFPRLDLSLLPSHLYRWDYGFVCYLGMLKCYEMNLNPTGRTFMRLMRKRLAALREEQGRDPVTGKPRTKGPVAPAPSNGTSADVELARVDGGGGTAAIQAARARSRWHLAYTLYYNPQLRFQRKRFLASQQARRRMDENVTSFSWGDGAQSAATEAGLGLAQQEGEDVALGRAVWQATDSEAATTNIAASRWAIAHGGAAHTAVADPDPTGRGGGDSTGAPELKEEVS